MSNHPYRLRRIELQDFKSVASSSVDLRPLTVVVGANSSGKSTLLQAILAIAQAVRSNVASPEFPLNGEFVRLGTFEETRNFLAERPDTPMRIAFDLVDLKRRPSLRGHHISAPRHEFLRFTWRAHLNRRDESESAGFARVAALQIEIASMSQVDDPEPELRLTCDLDAFGQSLTTPEGDLNRSHKQPIPSTVGRFSTGPFRGSPVEASGRVVDWSSGTSAPVNAVTLSGGLPASLLRRRSQFDELADLWWELASDVFSEEILDHRRRVQESGKRQRSYQAVRVAATHIAALMAPPEDDSDLESTFGMPQRELVLRYLGSLLPRQRSAVAKSLALLDPSDYRKRLRRELGDASWIDEELLVGPPGESGDLLWECGAASQRFFGNGIRYLGPLREAPHVLYDPGPSKLDLGVNGEYSAAVLHAQARSQVFMPTPDGSGERRPLNEALNFWLREFDLAENARSKDEGRMGIGLSVTPKGIGRAVDLTSVGVGVSQVLPVILLCLLAEPGTLVILEQPELHLHPRLETALADFLLACTRAGRQLVIETHSDHLVNRLRYQIARDETDDTHQLIGLVFAENENGTTSYREPSINPYGGLDDEWPAGFLDVTAKESQRLVQQSLVKRRRAEVSPDR